MAGTVPHAGSSGEKKYCFCLQKWQSGKGRQINRHYNSVSSVLNVPGEGKRNGEGQIRELEATGSR